MTATRQTGVIMIDTTTALAEWTVTGLNHHSETLLFRLPHHRQPDCLSCSFACRTAPSTSFYSRPTSSSSPLTRCSSFKDSRLPSTHPPVSITISRSPAPGNIHSFTLIPRITFQAQGIDQGKRSEEGTRTTASTCCSETRTLDTIEKGRR